MLTLIVNIIARWYVARGTRGQRAGGAGAGQAAVAGQSRKARANERSRRFSFPRSAPAAGAPTRSCAGVLVAGTVIALVPLVLIIYYLLYKGLG